MAKFSLLGASALQSAVVVGAFMIAQPAMAQTATTPPPPVTTEGQQANEEALAADDAQNPTAVSQPTPRDADGSDDEDETITVTGSRIQIPNLQSIEPTTTVDYRQVRERNFTNVADALNELPTVRGSVTPAGAQGSFGQGVNFVNTYGLGSNRTLTLINGRRFVSSNPATNFGNAASGTQVDLNIVPDILLDRIDLVSVGGAPVYGSDAIAGVVNVILRSKFKGLELSGVSGITEEGDNFRYNVSALAGHDFFGGRLNLTAAVSRDHVKGLLNNDRDFLRENVGGVTNPTAAQAGASRLPGFSTNDGRLNPDIGFNNSQTDGFPGVVQARNVGIPFLTSGGLITATNLACTAANRATNPASCFGLASPAALAFAPDGSLIPFNQGTLFGANTSASGVGGDGSGVFQFSNFGQITSDLRRTIVDAFATFEVTPEIEFFLEGKHYRSRADELVQQPTFNSSLFGGTSGPLTFRTTSPFLTPAAAAMLTARGVTQFSISRASSDIADLTGFNETRINRGVAGFRGDFGLFGREMNFEATVNYGKAKSRDIGQDINAQNFVNAVNVTTVNGQIVCTTAPTAGTAFASGGLNPIADPNCVPFNPLGFGRASDAARDYVVEDTVTRSAQRQIVANFNVGGTLFDLPGGGAAFNVGYEHRDEKAEFTPSDFQQAGRGRSVAIVPLKGRYNLDEVFGEVLLPIISADNDVPFISGLQVFARGRYVDNTVNGGFFSYAAGGSYAPIKDIEFRGNYTRSFRSPAITELFLPVVNAFSTVPDICSLGTRNGGAVPTVRAANCAAFLAAFPGSTPDPAATATVPIQTGGNTALENEKADSYTLGVILRPRFIPRLSLTADFVSITLKQPIASLTVAQVASACFDNTSFNTADPANGNSFCSLIRRDPATGRVIADPANPAVRVGFVNGVEIAYRGVQGTANYSLPLSGIGLPGTFSVGADALFTKYRQNNITGVAPSRSDGVIGDPAFAGQMRLRYANKYWGVNTTINYTGEQLFSRLNREVGVAGSGPDAREIDKLDDYAIVSGGVFFDPSDKFRLTFSVTNLFNRQGQEYFGTLLPASYVDLLGRRYAASARVRF